MDSCHNSLGYTLQHLTLGGGIALSVIALAAAAVGCVFFWSLSR